MLQKLNPHDYQKMGYQFLGKQKRGALWFDVGLGKTLITLLAFHYWPQMFPVLILGPKAVAQSTWKAEIEKWDFGFSCEFLSGKKRVEKLWADTQIKTANYEALAWIEEELREKERVPFNTIVIDESQFVKTPGKLRTNRTRAIAEHCEYRIELTATPTSQSYADIFTQMLILDDGEALGTNYHKFINKYFYKDGFNRPYLKPGSKEVIDQKIQHLVLRGDVNELLDMPEKVEVDIPLKMPTILQDQYDDLEEEFELLNEESEIRQGFSQLRTFCSGFQYVDDEGKRATEHIHDIKVDAIASLVDSLNGANLLVVTNYRGEREKLVERFGCDYIDGGTPSSRVPELMAAWNEGKIPMLSIHPASVGAGVNLQHGGRHICWFSMPVSPDAWIQTNGRLHRQGQTDTVMVYRLLMNNTLENAVAGLLERKKLTLKNVLGAIKRKARRV